jgi:phosphoglycerate dehydrogenase-like enzyme
MVGVIWLRRHFRLTPESPSIPINLWLGIRQAGLPRDFSGMVKKMGEESEKNTTRLIFCGPHFAASHIYTREYLQKYPYLQVDDVPFDDVPDVIGNYDICVVKSMRLTESIIARANKMKLIMQYGVGLEGIDISAATRHGIKVARIPSGETGNAASCAEMAIYLTLGLLRKQNEMQIAVKQKKVGEPVGETLLGKKVFIMGFGNIGIHLAKRLRPFGVKILATKRSWASSHGESHDDLIDEKGVHGDIYKFASRADIIICCLTMNSETAGIVDKTFLSSMQKGALLVNIARGGLLEYKAILENLESGHLGGLGIDVAWVEPFDPDDPVLKFPNVIITPHVAGVTEHSYRYMAKVVGDVALQLHVGMPLSELEFVN